VVQAHNQVSFELGNYERPGGEDISKAFETIVWLGSEELAHGTKIKNRFAGNIRFNPRFPDKTTKVGVDGLNGVFSFKAQDFAKIVHEHYYKKPPAASLDPRDLAAQISLAYAALRAVIPTPQTDVVMFKPDNAYIQEGFIVGSLRICATTGRRRTGRTYSAIMGLT
jgi:hypothetical protein